MCSDENAAPHAVRYFNAQLAALHKNAKLCFEEHGKTHGEEQKRFYALAEFRVLKPGTSDTVSFTTAFDKPEIEFICDHDAVLHLTLLNPRLMLDTRQGHGHDAKLPEHLQLSFRLGFETRTIIANDNKIAQTASTIELVILGLKKATLVNAEPQVTTGRDLLVKHIAEYFELLHDAGNHVLFSLPDFDSQPGLAPSIDYSLMRRDSHLNLSDVRGVSVDLINTYMSSMWLKSAMLAYTGNTSRTAVDWRLRCLAEFDSKWLGPTADYGRFNMRLGRPRVEVLCAKEAIVYFHINELSFFHADNSTKPERSYTKWTIAMVVDLVYSSEADGRVNIALDLDHARYHHLASLYYGLKTTDTLGNDHWRLLVTFFSEEYLQILKTTRYHVIYSRDTRWEALSKLPAVLHEDADGSWWSLDLVDNNGTESRETVQRTNMFGFDQVIAISQGSINAQFETLAANLQSIFARWSHSELFTASFKPLSVRLLSNNRAIVWVHLQGGHLKTLHNWAPSEQSMKHEFSECRLAFEVELKISSEQTFASSEAYRNSLAYKTHGNRGDRELRHIYLDLHHAEYLHEYSTFGNLSAGNQSVDKLQAIVYYLTQQYFPAICRDAQHVISSVPVWTASKSLPSCALTSFDFQVYSKFEVTRHNWAHVPAGTEPSLVLFGMTGFRPLVASQLDFSTGWVVQGLRGFSHGTVSVAKRVFVEERLLGLLSRVNALTTLIPTTPDMYRGFDGVELVTWANHAERKERSSKWELQPSTGDGALVYLWEHCVEWNFNLKGNNLMSAAHGVSCVTRNFVEIPTAAKHGALHVKINGSVQLSFTLKTTQLYTSSSSVKWSKQISLKTNGSAMKVDTLGSHDPVFAKTEFVGDGSAQKLRDAGNMLRSAFLTKVDLQGLMREMNAFEGIWQHCFPLASPYSLASPTFNDEGDLLFELRRHDAHAHLRAPGPASVSGRSVRSATSRSRLRSRTPAATGRAKPETPPELSPSLSSRSHSPTSPMASWTGTVDGVDQRRGALRSEETLGAGKVVHDIQVGVNIAMGEEIDHGHGHGEYRIHADGVQVAPGEQGGKGVVHTVNSGLLGPVELASAQRG